MQQLISHSVDLSNPPPLTEAKRAELEWLAARSDEEIDTSDIPPLDERFWANAVRFRGRALHWPFKKSTTLRLERRRAAVAQGERAGV